MLRGICFCICMSVMLSLFAQNEESNFIAPDRTVHKRSEIIKRAIKKVLNFSDFDTAYISPNRYNYALMLDHFTNYEYYSVGSGIPEPQRLRFSPKPHNKIGVYFGWRWLFLGWAVDADGLYGKKNGKKRGREFDLSLYSSKLGVDIFYKRTGNSVRL